MITYGTNPGMGLGISKSIQILKMLLKEKKLHAKSLGYRIQQGEAMIGKQIDYVFLGVVLMVVLKTLELCIDQRNEKSRKRYSMVGSGSHVVEAQIKKKEFLIY
jgi:3-isopropylmalate/(R)-2-methylmalate dehydratase large subunit